MYLLKAMVFMMKKCNECNIFIQDNNKICPLCHGALETVEGTNSINQYPNVHPKLKKLSLFLRIYLALSIVTETILITINYYTGHETWWSPFIGLYLLYGYFLMRFALVKSGSGRWRTVIGTFLIVFLIITADISNGYDGWSVNYILPIALGILNTISLYLIVLRRNHWQTYLVFQLTLLGISLISLILIPLNIITNPMIIVLVNIYIALSFVSVTIIGGNKAFTELRHRFHINR